MEDTNNRDLEERIKNCLIKIKEAIEIVKKSNEPQSVKEKAINSLKKKAKIISTLAIN
jgi:hypothetical protein